MLDLKARVHLQEERALAINHELDGSGSDVVDGVGGSPGCIMQRLAGAIGQAGRGRFLNDLLVPTLDGAIAVTEDPNRAVHVGDDLNLDMPGRGQIWLHEDGAVAERGGRFSRGLVEFALKVFGTLDDPHTSSAATSRRLHQEGEILGRGRVGIDLEDRYAGGLHELLGLDLRAHNGDRFGVRADPRQADGCDVASELSVLGQEAVAGVDGVGTGRLRRCDDEVAAQISIGRGVTGKMHRPVSLADERCVRVGVGVDRDGRDAEFTRSAKHPPGDLPAVRYKNGTDTQRNHTPPALDERSAFATACGSEPTSTAPVAFLESFEIKV